MVQCSIFVCKSELDFITSSYDLFIFAFFVKDFERQLKNEKSNREKSDREKDSLKKEIEDLREKLDALRQESSQ